MTLVIIFLSLFSLPSLAAVGGTEVGNGGDNLPLNHDVAWFIGENTPVEACLVRSAEFPLTSKEVRTAIQASYQHWIQYVDAKGVYDEGYLFPPEQETPRHATLRYPRELQLRARCDGKEDITFYLGSAPPKVAKIRRAYVNPVSFVHREKYSLAEGWSRGFVWVGKDGLAGRPWTTPYLFQSLLLHEMGHIFGVNHVPDTIMSQNFVRETSLRLKDAEDRDTNYGKEKGDHYRQRILTSIDTWQQLFVCLNCNASLNNILPSMRAEDLVGRKINSSLQCALNFQDRFLWEFTLDCQDESRQHLWRITPTYTPRFVSNGIEIFKRALLPKGQDLIRESARSMNGQVIYGKLATANGANYSVIVERNLGGENPIFIVNLVFEGEVERLFDSISQLGLTPSP